MIYNGQDTGLVALGLNQIKVIGDDRKNIRIYLLLCFNETTLQNKETFCHPLFQIARVEVRQVLSWVHTARYSAEFAESASVNAAVRERKFSSRAGVFSTFSTTKALSDYRLSQAIGLFLFQRIFTNTKYFICCQLPLNRLSSKVYLLQSTNFIVSLTAL